MRILKIQQDEYAEVIFQRDPETDQLFCLQWARRTEDHSKFEERLLGVWPNAERRPSHITDLAVWELENGEQKEKGKTKEAGHGES